MPAEIQRFASFFLAMDPPRHSIYRRLISSAFTPRNVRQIEGQIHSNAVGNQLAKAELRNLFRELLTRLTTVEFGEPDLLYSSFVHGVKRLPAVVQ